MGRVDQVVTNFCIYEDAKELLGMAEVTLPEISNLTQEISGAGIAGNVEAVVIGHLAAMTMTLNFRTVTEAALRLTEPRIHKIELRVAQQGENTTTRNIEITSMKYILHIKPKKFAPGKAAPASTADASGEYAVSYYAMYSNGKKKIEVDPFNFIYYINGEDHMKKIRKALGK